MKSWTLIPFYLWKNTFRRWFEYPVSPVSKMLIPALLGFPGGDRAHLVRRNRAGAPPSVGEGLRLFGLCERVRGRRECTPRCCGKVMRTSSCGPPATDADAVKHLRQPLTSAVWNRNQSVPVYRLQLRKSKDWTPTAGKRIFRWRGCSADSSGTRPREEISISGKRTLARTAAVPSMAPQRVVC